MERIERLAAHFAPEGEALSMSASPTSGCSKFNVAILGAAGGIGQPLSLLMKLSPRVRELRLYDVADPVGVAADLSHCATGAKVLGFCGKPNDDAGLEEALRGCDLVIIPAGIPRKPGMTRDDLFAINAGIVAKLAAGCAKYCPRAWIAVISNPVNSTVPIAAEVLKKHGVYEPRRLFGVTTLDVQRAQVFVGELTSTDPAQVNVPVVGGHAGRTILPLLSRAAPLPALETEAERRLAERIQNAGTEVVEAKKGAGSATLSMAYAAARFAESALAAMAGVRGIVECTYVASTLTRAPFFASPVVLGQDGVEAFKPLPDMNALEQANFDEMLAELSQSIDKGVQFAAKNA